MELLDKYGDRLTVRDRFFEPEYKPNYQSESRINVAAAAAAAPLSSVGQVLTGILALVATFAAGCIG
jgi:hypothetical protein